MNCRRIGNSLFIAITITITFLLFHGCTESTLNTDSNQTTAEVQTSKADYVELIQQANSQYYQLADMIPGFGGVFLEEKGTRFVIRTTDVDAINKPTIENNVKNYLQEVTPIVGSSVEGGVYGMDIRFAKADYEYNQLSEWQDQITESVLDSEGVTFIAISHKHNKIEIGIENETFKNQIIVLIKANNLPEGAIKTTVTGPIESLMSHHTLRDMQRPLRGGLENNLYNSSGNRLRGACTYSFNALRNGVRHWVTNTHCTRDYWGVNQNDEYYQASIADGTSGYVGYEVMDPQGFNIPFLGCSSTPCRFSDAALLRLPGGQNWDFGTIARTDEFGALPGQGRGSIVIDSSDPHFNIVDVAEGSNYFEGLWTSKVGRTSGWTIGVVQNTCAHVDVPNSLTGIGDVRLLCQELTTMHAEGGDSGSPVFAPSGPTNVTLYGVVWGLSTTGLTIFSRYEGVQEDLGSMDVH